MKQTSFVAEFFVTQVLHAPVVDRAGEDVGVISDFTISSGESFPKITGCEIKTPQKPVIVELSGVNLLSKRVVTLNDFFRNIVTRDPMPDDLLLVKDFLDKQILDINGAKVVRVNDLKLARLNGDIHLIAADVGISGLLRRMGLETIVGGTLHLFGKHLPPQLIPWNFVEPISGQNLKMKLTVPQSKISQLHPADIAEILSELSPQERTAVMESLDEETAADALHDVEPKLSLEILDDLPPERAAHILEEMSPDDAADILSGLPEEQVQTILSSISHEEAADLKKLLRHDEDTAGGHMTTEFISLPETLTVDQTIERLREMSPDAETIYYLYIVDSEGRFAGVLSLRDLIVSKPNLPLKAVMTRKMVKVPPSARKEEVAELIAKYDFLALPVVDESDRILGIVTVDDVVDELVPRRWKRKARGG